MNNKQNPLLAKFEAQLEAQHRSRLAMHSEIDLIVFMLTINEDLHVGPGRATKLCNDFLATKIEVAEMISSDYGNKKDEGDKELLHSKVVLVRRLKKIFSCEDWQKVRPLFPMLHEYWDAEV